MSDRETDLPAIRAAARADIPAINRVHAASIRGLCVTAYPPEVIERWASNPDLSRYEKMLAPDTRSAVVVAGEGICAFGSVQLVKSCLESLFVHPDYARSGIGRRLLRHLEQTARAAGLTRLKLQASLNAREFYVRHGYRLIRTARHRMSTGMELDCHEMEKTLDR